MKCCWILSKAFSASIEMIKWFLLGCVSEEHFGSLLWNSSLSQSKNMGWISDSHEFLQLVWGTKVGCLGAEVLTEDSVVFSRSVLKVRVI
jgi:hypothetical protein